MTLTIHWLQSVTVISLTVLVDQDPEVPLDPKWDTPRWLHPKQVNKRRGHWLVLDQGRCLALRSDAMDFEFDP